MAILRQAIPADLPALHALIDASVRGLSTHVYSPRQIESSLRFVFGPDTQLIADATYYVIEEEGALAAAGGWSRRATLYGGDQLKGESDPLLDPARDPARIRAFFVHPAWARRGFGRMLFGECEAAARRHGFQRLELMATLPGEPLYRALGFEAVEHLSLAMPDGVELPLIRMQRPIPAGAGAAPVPA